MNTNSLQPRDVPTLVNFASSKPLVRKKSTTACVVATSKGYPPNQSSASVVKDIPRELSYSRYRFVGFFWRIKTSISAPRVTSQVREVIARQYRGTIPRLY